MAVDRKTYSWEYREVPQKDRNANQWNFSYDKKVSGKREIACRSYSSLKESFKNTPFTIPESKRLNSRYTALYNAFKNKYAQYTQNITHLLITFDKVYFLLDGVSDVKTFTYGTDICPYENIPALANGVMQKSNVFDVFFKFKMDDVTTRSLAKTYIDTRRNMAFIDTNKPVIDVLKSDIPFGKLKYVFFVPTPTNSLDFSAAIYNVLKTNYGNYLSMKEAGERVSIELSNIISLQKELAAVDNFADYLNKGTDMKTLSYVYKIMRLPKVDKETANDIFLNHFDKYAASKIYMSKNEQEKLKKQEDKRIEEVNKIRQSRINEIMKPYNNIMSLIEGMNRIVKLGNDMYDVAEKKKGLDLNKWILEYSLEAITRKIDLLYKSYSKFEKDEIYPICKILKIINKVNEDEEVFIKNNEQIEYFDKYLPSYFKDDRLKITGYGISDVETLEKTKKTLNDILKILIHFSELLSGVEYGLFAFYMACYGESAMIAMAAFMDNFLAVYNKDNLMKITNNTLSYGNRMYYYFKLPNDFKNDFIDGDVDEKVAVENMRKKMGTSADFLAACIKQLMGEFTEKDYMARNDNMNIDEQCKVIKDMFDCIYQIILQIKYFYDIL